MFESNVISYEYQTGAVNLNVKYKFESNVISYEYQTYDIKEIDKSIKIYGLDNIVTINKETKLIHILGGKNEFNRKTN
jgi:hypothetical protein